MSGESTESAEPRIHRCPVCGVEFPIERGYAPSDYLCPGHVLTGGWTPGTPPKRKAARPDPDGTGDRPAPTGSPWAPRFPRLFGSLDDFPQSWRSGKKGRRKS